MISGMRTRGGGPCPFLDMPERLVYLQKGSAGPRQQQVQAERQGAHKVASSLGTVTLVDFQSKAAAYLEDESR